MMRLINEDDLLKVPNVRKVEEYDETGTSIAYLAVPVEAIEKAPTIEAEPVVRCKDCKYWERDWVPNMYTPVDETHICPMVGKCTYDDFFCAYGEKMDLEG